ncbi:MAG: sugar phosphate isomerase/epimerase [Synergistaceae bacterium]|nr:sugar phosphate isomerase/epimerase [Synergistaceae bacterium]
MDNLKWLSGKVDEVQLVLFETPELSNIPTASDVEEFKRIAEDAGLAFTVHLPGDIELASSDETQRRTSIERFKRIVKLSQPLSPICWVLHLSLPPEGEDPEVHIDRLRSSMNQLTGEFSSPRDLAVENIHKTFEVETVIVELFDTSVCVDIGHLLLFNADIWQHLDQWLPRCRNVHLHGTKDGRDHESLDCLPFGFAGDLFRRLSLEPGLETVTMEVFGMEDFEKSVTALCADDVKIY